MAEYLIQDSTLSAIADAIRSKTGKADKITPEQMPTEIAGITTGVDVTLLDNINIILDFATGDQTVLAPEGYAVKGATILKPDTLTPENIAEGVEIAGVVGTHAGGGGSSPDVRYVTFMNGDTVLYKKPVAVGDDCVDVLTKGLIETSTKESTAQYNYTFYGWGASDGGAADANILKNITEDKTVYAIFAATVRYYTITYYDSDGTTVLKTESLAYGATPSAPGKAGYEGIWTPTITTVTGDASYVVQWAEIAGEPLGDYCTWLLQDGVLTINGSGPMPDFTSGSDTNIPWLSEKDSITQVVIKDGVTHIGKYSFYGHTSITSITISDSVTTIGERAFYGCTALLKITIPNGVTSIGSYAFMSCSGATSVSIGNSVITIGTQAFGGCKKLTSVTIPDSVTEIDSYAFNGCTSLASVTIGTGVTRIRNYAFTNSGLTKATFKNTSGWYVSKTYNATSGTSVTVTSASTAATNLKTTYDDYHWFRN